MADDEDAQTAALQEYFDSNKPAGYGASFRAGWNAARVTDRTAEVEAMRKALHRVADEFHFQHVIAEGVWVGDSKIPGMLNCPQKFCAIASAALSTSGREGHDGMG
jgi:hypothetical protein